MRKPLSSKAYRDLREYSRARRLIRAGLAPWKKHPAHKGFSAQNMTENITNPALRH